MAAARTLLEMVSRSAARTRKIGQVLGKALPPGTILALHGNLGSGKTVLVQGLARGLGVLDSKEIRSPTFALIQEHAGPTPLCHADLYRLSGPETRGLGLEEYWRPGSPWVSAIEWAEKAGDFLPGAAKSEQVLEIYFEVLGPASRKLKFFGKGPWKKRLKKLGF